MYGDRNDSPPGYDTWFELLADGFRRRVLFELSDRSAAPSTVTVPDDVVREGEDAETVHLHLSHIHLPKLAAAGVIEWEPGSGTVTAAEPFEQLRPLLRAVRALEGFEGD